MATFVLLHGLAGSGATWAPVARALRARGHTVVAPDARPRATYAALADDVVPLLPPADPPILVGHSMGGLTAAVVAARPAVRLRAVILVDPTFLEPARQAEVHASDVAAQHRRLATLPRADVLADLRARHPHRSLEILEALADARRATDPAAFAILAPPNPDFRALVRAFTAPAHVVVGDREPVVTPALAASLGLPCTVIAGAGHGLPYDQPAALADVIAAGY